MDKNTLLLIVVAIAVGLVIILIISGPKPTKPIVDNADDVSELAWHHIPVELTAIPRPLIEWIDAGLTLPLIKNSSQLEGEARKVIPRPLVEYANCALGLTVQPIETSPATLPRPLVEYAESAILLALDQPGQDLISYAARVRSRPLVEYANAGWIGSLSPPLRLLEGE
jgi:hypothetical protein